MTSFEQDVAATQPYFDSPRFEGITRLYSARQVVEQRGTIPHRLHRGARGRGGLLRPPARAVRRAARASPPSAPTRPARR